MIDLAGRGIFSYVYDERGRLLLIAMLGSKYETLWWFGPTGDEW